VKLPDRERDNFSATLPLAEFWYFCGKKYKKKIKIILGDPEINSG